MKKTLFVLGIGAVVGVITYAVWQSVKKQKTAVVVDEEQKNENHPEVVSASIPAQEVSADEVGFAKKATEDSIIERHKEAAQIIKETVDVICKQSASSPNEQKELDQIASGLDDLLKED